MKHAGWLWLLPVFVIVVCGYWAGFSGDDAQAVAAPPLSLEGYLDEKLPEASPKKTELKVDNFACYVCHGNYDGEQLVVTHGKEKIGCIDCHGQSHPHRNDEDNVTPPEKMYVPQDVDKMCGTCHKNHDVAAVDVIAHWQERCSAETDPQKIVCTDCHGNHRLRLRTVWWDKKTGKLIVRTEGERTKVGPDRMDKNPRHQSDDQTAPDSEMH